jgi:regulator of sigma E protease
MSFALVFAALSLLTLIHELGHAAMARALGLHVTVLSVGFGPPFARFRVRGVAVLLCVVPFGGFVRVAELSGDEPTELPLARKLAVILAGSGANYALAALLGVGLTLGWGRETGRVEGLEITAVSERATQAGLAMGDVIVRADDREVASVQALQEVFQAANGAAVRLDVTRASVVRRVEAIAEPGRAGLGARYVPRPELVRDGALRAIGSGLLDPARRTATLARNGYATIVERFAPTRGGARGGTSARPASPIGLASRVAQSGRWDARRVLSFGALLTVVIGLFNLLPLPGLDGGRAALALIERARGRRLRARAAFAIQLAGGLALFAAAAVLVVLDVIGR